MQKFDELIAKEVSEEIRQRFPADIISITQVHVSKDLSFAKIWLSSIGDIDQIVKEAKTYATDIRKILSKKVVARRVPKLYFVADKTEEKAMKIENLLSEIKKDDKDDAD